MSTKVPSSNPSQVDEALKLIAQRVSDYKNRKDTSDLNADEVDIHIEALSDVFELDKTEVELIAKEVLIKQEQKRTLKDTLINGILKYGKEVIATIIIIAVVAFLLLGRSSIQSQTSPTLEGSIAALESLASNANTNIKTPEYYHYKKKAEMGAALGSTSFLKLLILEYYQYEGKYPQSLGDIDFNRSEMKSKYIDDLILAENGRIVIKLNKSIEKNLFISLHPIRTMGGMNLEWECETSFSGYFPGCERHDAKKYLAMFE